MHDQIERAFSGGMNSERKFRKTCQNNCLRTIGHKEIAGSNSKGSAEVLLCAFKIGVVPYKKNRRKINFWKSCYYFIISYRNSINENLKISQIKCEGNFKNISKEVPKINLEKITNEIAEPIFKIIAEAVSEEKAKEMSTTNCWSFKQFNKFPNVLWKYCSDKSKDTILSAFLKNSNYRKK